MRLPPREYKRIETDNGRVFIEFTGYVDADNKNVYYGDVLDKFGETFTVGPPNKFGIFTVISSNTGKTQPIQLFDFKDANVIGNILNLKKC